MKKLLWNIDLRLENIKHKIMSRKYAKQYSDYADDEYNDGSLKFIWGIKSYDDLSDSDANLYTMNDIEIVYDRDTKQYMLGIETSYLFDDIQADCEYYKRLLDYFTQYMNDNGLSTEPHYCPFFANLDMRFEADSIEELYTRFKIVVTGFYNVFAEERTREEQYNDE